MRNSIEQLRSRLVELDCPLPRLKRMVQEVAEHREDLLRGLLAQGIPTAEAEALADLRLGDPRTLAEKLMESLRQSSWCGRHRFIAFGLLPVLGFPLFWFALLCLNLSLAYAFGFGWNHQKLQAAAGDPSAFHHLLLVAYGADYLATAVVALAFCLLMRHAAVSRNWILFGCSICVIYSLFTFTYISPHNYTIGAGSHPQWIRGAISLLIVYLSQAHRLRKFRLMEYPFARVV